MAEKLKPCPFCGGEARLVVCDSEGNVHDESYEADPYSGLSYAIVHGSDGCCGECPVSTSDLLPWLYETREEAAKAWNRRSERTCRMEYQTGPDNPKRGWFECSECGGLGDSVGAGWDGKKMRKNPPAYCPRCGARVVSE